MENTAVLETQPASDPVVEQKNEVLEAALKRALDEVNALEMTQQILAMVERSMQKTIVKDYNTVGVKKYLHELYSLPTEASTEEVNGMEFIFWQEVQLWRTALSQRDGFISVSDLRHYCENSRPPLSEQALLSLARFYRGLPASEKTTSKFDMILTRLFSKDEEDGTRRLSGTRTTVADTIDEYYSEWLGISPQNVIEEEKITGAVKKFNEFIAKAGDALNFDTLIDNNFFGDIKDYKKSLNQIFYAPQVAAAAVECNVKVGNRFVELLDRYRQAKRAEGVRMADPLDPMLEETVSETTNRTLKAVYEAQKNHAKMMAQREKQKLLDVENFSMPESTPKAPPPKEKSDGFLGINKWLLIGGFVAILMSGLLYVWAEYGGAASSTTKSAQKLNEKELPGGEYLTTARVNNSAFYGIVTPKWNSLTEENKKKVLDQLVNAGKEKGYSQVSLLTNDGKMIGHGSPNEIKLF